MGKVLSITSAPLQAKQLIRSTASMFFISWKMQYDENGCSYGWLVIGSFTTTTCPLIHFIFGETSSHPSDSAPLQPRFGVLWLLAFPKTKIIFEGEETYDHRWDSGTHDRIADGNSNEGYFRVFWTVEMMLGEPCEVPWCLLWWGLRHHHLMYNISFILFFNKCLYFT